jgi:hypothetical protein
MGNLKNKKITGKPLMESSGSDKLAKYASAPYFRKKDKKAVEFLQKHPVPAKFLK